MSFRRHWRSSALSNQLFALQYETIPAMRWERADLFERCRNPLRSLYHRAFPRMVRAGAFLADLGRRGDNDDVPPALFRYRVSQSLSVREFAAIGQRCAQQLQEVAEASGVDLFHAGKVLDFGCGCGRTLRWILSRSHTSRLFGVDVDTEAIDWCAAHLPQATFFANTTMPPLPFADGFFDAAYCISVFTHLDEDLQDQWLFELARVVRPGGLMIISVHGANAQASLSARRLRALQEYGFLHEKSDKLLGIVPNDYYTTWHTPSYIVGRLQSHFASVRYVPIPDGMQDYVIACHGHGPGLADNP